MDKNKKKIIGILTAAIVLVVAFIVYITCFDSHIEFSSKFKNGITVEYGKKFEPPFNAISGAFLSPQNHFYFHH